MDANPNFPADRWIDGIDPMAIFRTGEELFRAGRLTEARAEFRRFLSLYRQASVPIPDLGQPDETGVLPLANAARPGSVFAAVLAMSRIAAHDPARVAGIARTVISLAGPGKQMPDETPENAARLWAAFDADTADLRSAYAEVFAGRGDTLVRACVVLDRLVNAISSLGMDDELRLLLSHALYAAGRVADAEAMHGALSKQLPSLSGLIAANARHDPKSLGGAIFALNWLNSRIDSALARQALAAFQAIDPATMAADPVRMGCRLWEELADVTAAWPGPLGEHLHGFAKEAALPYIVTDRLRRRDAAALAEPDYAFFAVRALALGADLDAGPIAEALAQQRPASRQLANSLTDMLLDLVDWPSACRLALRSEALRIAERRAAARRGTLLVIFEDYLWSFGDTACRLEAVHHLRREGRIDWFPLVIDAVPEHNPRGLTNPYLLDAWSRHFPVVRDGALMECVRSAADTIQRNEGEYYVLDRDRCVNNNQALYEVYLNAKTAGYKPTLAISDEELAWGRKEITERFGVPSAAWFVCLHVRGPGWHSDSPHTEKWAKIANPLSYVDALKVIAAAGGYVFRLGDPSMPPLPALDGVIDIAHSPAKSNRLDMFLCGAARFMVSTCSGPAGVASAHGVPLVVTNAMPIDTGALRPGDLFIHKMLRMRHNGRLVPFAHLMKPPLQETRRPQTLFERGFDVIDNTADEIAEAASEMIALLDGSTPFSEEDEALSRRYLDLSVSHPRPMGLVGRPSAYFLRKHRSLFDAPRPMNSESAHTATNRSLIAENDL